MSRIEDKRIDEALELLNAVARDNKAELQAAMETKYADLTAVINAFTDQVKNRATQQYEAGKQKVVDVANDIDKNVHQNPWAYIGGAAALGLVLGMLLSRPRRD